MAVFTTPTTWQLLAEGSVGTSRQRHRDSSDSGTDGLLMTRTVNIEVYCDSREGERDVFAVASEHRADLPKPFDAQLQEWAKEHFSHLDIGDQIPEAGELIYEPSGDIVEIRAK